MNILMDFEYTQIHGFWIAGLHAVPLRYGSKKGNKSDKIILTPKTQFVKRIARAASPQ